MSAITTLRVGKQRHILRARPFFKPTKITVKAVCARRPTANSKGALVYAKTTLTLILARFEPGAYRKDGPDWRCPWHRRPHPRLGVDRGG